MDNNEWAQLVGDLINAIEGIKTDAGRGVEVNFDSANILISAARKKLGLQRAEGWLKEDTEKDEITVGLPTKINTDYPIHGMPIRINTKDPSKESKSVMICELLLEGKSDRVIGLVISGFRKQEEASLCEEKK